MHVNNEDNMLSRIGRKDSTWIYILHPILIAVLGAIASKLDVETIYYYIRPFLVFIITTITVEVLLLVKEKIRGNSNGI